MAKNTIKFLHLADLHLDQPLSGGKLKLPFEKVERRSHEIRQSFIRAAELAANENVDIILIAGDLWEEDNLAVDTVPFVMETLSKAQIPVAISPGNHDYYSPVSHYSKDITSARFGRTFADNIHVFGNYEFDHFTFPQLENVALTGIAYRSNQAVSLRRLGVRIKLPKVEFNIAVVHGSRDDFLPPGKMRTLPFSDKELLAQQFDYTALGHYHSLSTIKDDKDLIRAAYPGSTCALAVDEKGPHGAIIGVLEAGGVRPENLEFHELDTRRIHQLELDISGLQHVPAVEKKIEVALNESQVRKEDIAYMKLQGTFISGSRISISEDFLREACYHMRVDTVDVRPEWSLDEDESINPLTTEAIFRKHLRELIEKAAQRGDQAEVTRLQNAMYYGLDALHGQAITPRRTN